MILRRYIPLSTTSGSEVKIPRKCSPIRISTPPISAPAPKE